MVVVFLILLFFCFFLFVFFFLVFCVFFCHSLKCSNSHECRVFFVLNQDRNFAIELNKMTDNAP